MTHPLKYVRPNILSLEPYSTARDEFSGDNISVWADANESPYPTGLNRYPDPHQKKLKRVIATLKGCDPENIFIGGAGSDEAIDLIYRIFCEPATDNVVAIAPSYGVYKVEAAINNVEFREVLLKEDFSLPVGRLLKATDRHTKVIWICSPNNPTANSFPAEKILSLAESFDGIVAVDEAYIDFSEEKSLLAEIATHPNLIVLQTFSKAWGMASLRVGMAFAVPEIARIFGMVKYPYNLNGSTQQELIKRITETDIRPMVTEIVEQRKLLAEELEKFSFVVKIYPSDANFLLVKVTDPDGLYSFLTDHGVIVRNRSRLKMCEGSLRITVGTPEENRIIIKQLKRFENVEC